MDMIPNESLIHLFDGYFKAYMVYIYQYYNTMGRRLLTLKERDRGRLLGQTISVTRKRLSISQVSLAKSANIDIDALRGLEQGRYSHPSFFTVMDIAHALGISIEELFQKTEEE